MTTDNQLINRCLQLASFAQGKTAPNPLVGAVIVHNGEIIGEGYHQFYGGAHAEVNAVAAVKNKDLLCKSTLYVNLEPCSHFGKTPPCVDLIIESKIPKVVVGMLDPNPKVNGKGIEKLRNAGIEVVVGVEEKKCRELNKIFITNIEKQRPYILLKWAQTADGFIDIIRQTADIEPLKISNAVTKTLNHQLRTQYSAILTGTKTALLDNPKLTVTKWTGKSPVRMVIDKNLILPNSYNIFDNSAKSIIFCSLLSFLRRQESLDIKTIAGHTSTSLSNHTSASLGNQARNDNALLFKEKNTEFVTLNFEENIIPQILNYLYINKLSSIIVEGGRQLLQAFIDQNLWDECHIETSPQIISNGVSAPIFPKEKPCKTTFYRDNSMQIISVFS